jgi:hypothetical protein
MIIHSVAENSFIPTTSKKLKYFVSPNRYFALTDTDPVLIASNDINKDNQIDFDIQSVDIALFYIHIHKQKKRLVITNDGLINFSKLRTAFSDLISLGSFSCKFTSIRLKVQSNTSENYRKIIHFLNENNIEFLTNQL